MRSEHFLTTSLRAAPWGAAVTHVLSAAIAAVEPAAAVRRYLQRDGTRLMVADQSYDLAQFDRVLVVAVGKAGAPMARAAAEVLGADLFAGLAVVKEGYAQASSVAALPSTSMTLVEAGHPLPDARSVEGAQQVARLLAGLTARDLVLVLMSGGGSALLTLPVPGVSLADLQNLTSALLRCGASINEINTLRKHLDQVKGGGLVRMAHPAPLAALILSDVVGSPLDIIASGPTVPDSSTFADALAVLERYGIAADTPAPIMQHLRRGLAAPELESLKPGDPRFAHVTNLLVGSNPQAAAAAQAAAQAAGQHALLLTTFVQGEAREVGRVLAAIGREIAESGQPLQRPACLIAGGETTVTLRGTGLGGRNQELALAAVRDLDGLADLALVTLATDGGDGPTDAAGAVVTGTTLARAQALGLDVDAHLARNDAYPFFDALGDLLKPGPTQTNVNDLAFIFAF